MHRFALGFVSVSLLGLGLTTGFRPFYLLLYALLTGILIGHMWAWIQSLGLKVEVESQVPYPQVGQPLHLRIRVGERWGIPRVGLRIALPGHLEAQEEMALDLQPRGFAVQTTAVLGHRRGLNPIGPLTIVTTDTFGLVRRERSIGEANSVVVFPKTVPVFSQPSVTSGPVSRSSEEGVLAGVGASASRVRQYTSGDSLSRIHWPTTARLDQLMTKEFDGEGHGDVWLFLDLQSTAQVGSGAEGTEEYSITLAASLAKGLLEAGEPVGLVAQGDELLHFVPRRDQGYLWELLKALAVVKARGRIPISTVVAQQSRELGPGSVAVVIAPWHGQDLTGLSYDLFRRGVTTLVVLLDAFSFDGKPESPWLRGARAKVQGWATLVFKGDDLSQRLRDVLTRLGH